LPNLILILASVAGPEERQHSPVAGEEENIRGKVEVDGAIKAV